MAASDTGRLLGGTLGSAAGSVIPGVGTAIGGAVGQGIGGALGGIADKRKAASLEPSAVDPFELQRMAELDQTRRSISTGSDVGTQSRINEVRNLGASTQNALSKVTGGDVGGTMSALLRAQRGTQTGINQAISEGQKRLPFFENLTQQLGTRISQRKLELGLLGANQARAEGSQGITDATQTLNALGATQGSLPGGKRDLLGDLLSGAGEAVGGLLGGGDSNNTSIPSPGVPPGATPGIAPPIDPVNRGGGTLEATSGIIGAANRAIPQIPQIPLGLTR